MPAATKDRQLTLIQKTFLQYYLDPDQLNPEGKRTFGNATRSYALSHQRPCDNTSATEGNRALRLPHVQSELERITDGLDFGIQVRLGIMAEIAKGRTSRTARSKQYQNYTDDNGKRKRRVAGEMVTVTGTRDSDKIRAVAMTNKMTGLDALHTATAEVAAREAKSLYDRIVKPGRKENTPKSTDSIRPESTPKE